MSTDDLHGDGIEREHARLGLSGSEWWASCTAGPAEADGKPDNAFERTRHGSCAHAVSEACLLDFKVQPQYFFGKRYVFWEHAESDSKGHGWLDEIAPRYDDGIQEPGFEVIHTVTVGDDLIEESATYVEFVRDLVRNIGGELHVEVRMSISHITKERNAKGTADVVLLDRRNRVMYVIDAKFGFKKVDAYKDTTLPEDPLSGEPAKVLRTPNLQLGGYADAALEQFDPFGLDFDKVVLMIVQPAINHFSEATFTIDEIRAVAQFLRERADATRTNPQFAPSFETCMFCRAKDTCKARDRSIVEEVTGGFQELDEHPLRPVPDEELGHVYERLAEIEDWCADKRRRVRAELMSGRPVVGRVEPYKLVAGDQGDREWGSNEAQVELMLSKTFRLPEEVIFKKKLISPAGAEKLTKKKRGSKDAPPIGPTQWERLSKLITRAPAGQPKIVPLSDDRPALSTAVDGLQDLEAASLPAADCADLFD